MILVGITGKSGSGKSYFAKKLAESIEKSSVISIDHIFSRLMNNGQVINIIVKEYGQSVLKDGEIDLDVILNHKEIFSRIYEIIGNDLESEIEGELEEREKSGEKACIMEWWGLPNTDLINQCDCSIYIQANSKERLEALKNRETYMTQESMTERDNVLGADYASKEYDLVIQNDYEEKTIAKVIDLVKEQIKLKRFSVEELATFKDRSIEGKNRALNKIAQDKNVEDKNKQDKRNEQTEEK